MVKTRLLCSLIVLFFFIATGEGAVFHTVKKGETLWRISKNHGVTLESLIAANSLFSANITGVKVGQKLVIPDLSPRQKGIEPEAKKGTENATPCLPKFSPEKFKIKTIVIDPGHGGKDPGAIGRDGLLEKDVVLDIARRLEAKVKEELPEVNVILTRQGDYFIPLRQRTALANQKKADLFISIHANAAYSREANGFEVYHLSLVASDNHSRALAAAENEVVRLEEDYQKTNKIDPVKFILGDLAQNEFINESVELAGWIQTGVNKRLKVEDRGIKGAFFWVLKNAMMPAVLIETAFISNPLDEKKLRCDEFKNTIAMSIGDSIVKYKSLYEGQLVQIAERK